MKLPVLTVIIHLGSRRLFYYHACLKVSNVMQITGSVIQANTFQDMFSILTFDCLFQSQHLWRRSEIKLSPKVAIWKCFVMWLQEFLIQLQCGQTPHLVNISRETHWTSLTSPERKPENTGALQTTLVERHLQWWTLMCNVRTQGNYRSFYMSFKLERLNKKGRKAMQLTKCMHQVLMSRSC